MPFRSELFLLEQIANQEPVRINGLTRHEDYPHFLGVAEDWKG
jgi:hypothetical protein